MTGNGTLSSTDARLRAILDELSGQFFERSDVLRALVVALLAGQHSLLLGPPGAAKSELARALTARFTGANYWEILLSKFTDPKQIFGPIDVGRLMAGEYTQVFAGRATEAHIALIDEIFKCSAGALNAMLALLNERLYHPENGGEPIDCPLIGAITASNELPTGEDLSAVYDRLLVRLEVEYITDPGNFASLLRTGTQQAAAPAAPTTITLDALLQAVKTDVPAVTVPDGILDMVSALRTALRHRDMICSDRRWRQSIRLLQASAYLASRTEVTDLDLDILRHVLWDSTSQRRTVAEEVLTLVNPDAREALDLVEAIDALEKELEANNGQSTQTLSTWALEANPKLARAGKRLEVMLADARKAGRSTDVIDEALARQKAVYSRVLAEALGVNPTALAGAN